ncbi:MAG TPA: ECF transporter S component [Clostridia bacterium]|nr:ECF transporter S component [Clostridia bacterium]
MKRTVFLVQLSLFTAIELIFCFTPLGSIPISPGIVATLAHIPALIAALSLGVYAAGFMGLVMGISSFIVWTFMPPVPPAAFAFTPFAPYGNIFSLIICILPRTVFPIITALIHRRLKNSIRLPVSAGVSAAVGTFMHSFLVLSGIYLAFYSNPMVGGDYINFLVAWGGVNALMEILLGAVISSAVIVPLNRFATSLERRN